MVRWLTDSVAGIWPGFAINTAFYALVLWMLFAGPRALNRKRRRMRGLCVKCAYDLRGHRDREHPHPRPLSQGKREVLCPECGTAIELRKPTTETPTAESG
jgi:hypothetical protein